GRASPPLTPLLELEDLRAEEKVAREVGQQGKDNDDRNGLHQPSKLEVRRDQARPRHLETRSCGAEYPNEADPISGNADPVPGSGGRPPLDPDPDLGNARPDLEVRLADRDDPRILDPTPLALPSLRLRVATP